MERLEKKCLLASSGLHLFLGLLLIFGSAFFVGKPPAPPTQPLRLVPGILIDKAFSGGGGNPRVAPSDARQKGETLTPQPPKAEQVQPRPEPPVQQTKREEPRVQKTPQKQPDPPLKPTTRTNPNARQAPDKSAVPDLKPIIRTDKDRAKAQAEADARAARERAAANKKLADQFAKSADSLREGFTGGTQIEVHGTGGIAYANYAQFVREVYDNAWVITDDLTDEEPTARVSITVARNGNVISARIVKRSGNTALDRSVQRALDRVKFIREFPADDKDTERTYIINFNLKAKRLFG